MSIGEYLAVALIVFGLVVLIILFIHRKPIAMVPAKRSKSWSIEAIEHIESDGHHWILWAIHHDYWRGGLHVDYCEFLSVTHDPDCSTCKEEAPNVG